MVKINLDLSDLNMFDLISDQARGSLGLGEGKRSTEGHNCFKSKNKNIEKED